jgi:hypothetical protein
MQEGILRVDVAEVGLGELGHDAGAGKLLVATRGMARVAIMRACCATSTSATRQAQSAANDAREVDSRRRPKVLWLAPGGTKTEKCDLVAEKVTFVSIVTVIGRLLCRSARSNIRSTSRVRYGTVSLLRLLKESSKVVNRHLWP